MRTGLAIATVIGTGLSGAAILWAGSYPSGELIAALVGYVLALLTGVAWLMLLVIEFVGRRARLVVTAAVLAAVVIGGSGLAARIELPLLARFALSRFAFERVIAEFGEAGPDAPCPSWIGSYRIRSCRTIGSNTYFTERDGGFLNTVGFVYLPDGAPADPPTDTSITYGQLRGPWYAFVEAW